MANRLAIEKKSDRLAISDQSVIDPQALITFELLNDPNSIVEGFMPQAEADIVSEGFSMSDDPKADRLRLTENMMIAASVGTDLASADANHDMIKRTGFLETLKEEWTDPVRLGNKIPITGALFGIYEMADIMKSARRLNDPNFDYSVPFQPKPSFGEQVGLLQVPLQKQPIFFTREGDTRVVEKYIDRVTKDRTFLGKVAAGISILPTWMVEFALTGGLAAIGKESTKNAMVKVLGRYSKTKIGNAAMRATGWTGGAVTRATLGLPLRVVEEAAERQTQARIGLREQEGWASSFAKAWGDVVIESASEEAGAAITGAGAAVLRRIPFGSKIVAGLEKAWISVTGGTKGEFARQLFAKGGYSNILGEIGEERLGTILRATTDVEDFGAGPEAGPLERLAAGMRQDIKNIGVEAVVLSLPLAGQSIISRFGRDADKAPITEAAVAPVAAKVAPTRPVVPSAAKVPAEIEKAGAVKVADIPGIDKKFDQVTVPEGENKVEFFLEGEKVHEIQVESAEEVTQIFESHQTILEEKGEVQPTAEIKEQNFTQFAVEKGLPTDFDITDHSLLSPSGKISKRAKGQALERLSERIKLNQQAHDEFEAAILAGEVVDSTGKITKESLQSEQKQKEQNKINSRINQIENQIRNLENLPKGKRGVRPSIQKEIDNLKIEIAELLLPEPTTQAPAAPERVEPSPGDKIVIDVLKGKIARAKTDKSRAELQRRLDILEGRPVKPPISKPTKEEQRVIDAKKFNADIKAHEAQVRGEEGTIEIKTEDVDDITEPFGRIMTPEWYTANSKVYKKTILEKGTDLAKKTIKGLDFLGGVTSTRLRNISPELGRRLRRNEFDVMTRTTEQVKRVEPFLKATTKRKLGKDFAAFDIAFKNSEGKIVAEFAKKHGFTRELKEIRRVLDELFNQGNAVGLEIDYRKEYFPRVVKDTKGFLEFFQKGDDWSIIRTVIEDKETARGRALTESERAAAVNTLLRGYRTSALTLTAPGAAKARTVQEVTPEINQFYQGFSNSLTNYIEIMNEKIASREFFGRQSKEITNLRAQQSTLRTRLAKLSTRQGRQKPADADKEIRLGFFTGTLTQHISRAQDQFEEVTEKLDRMGADDLSNTIGQYVLELVVNDEIKPSQEKEVRDLLMGRFDPKGAHGLIGEIIPLTYIDVLSQITNSLTQLEELALAFYRSPAGFVPAATKAALNLSDITLEDIGVTTVAQELTDADSRKILSSLLSITGFKKFDAFAKQTFINTALKQLQDQSKKEGMTFNDRLERVFGEETDQVVKDLKAGDITEDVKFLIASQLMDIQPIAKSEMPEAYNRAGNLRIFYQLKTFMIKQIDFVRTEALQDMRNPKADPARFMRGFGRLVWLSFSLALFGAGRDLLVDFITGRPFDLSDSVVDTFLRRIFFSRFQYSKATKEGFGTAFFEGLVPPTKTIDAVTKDIKKVSKNDEDGLEVWRSVPIVGELYYWWFGRGREKALREQRKARREKVRRKPLSTKRAALKTTRKPL